MLVLHIDTATIAVPNFARDASEAEQLLSRLIGWHDLIVAGSAFPVVRSSSCESALAEANAYPNRDILREFVQLFGCTHLSVDLLWTAYLSVLQRTLTEYDVAGFEIEACDESQVEPPMSTYAPASLVSSTLLAFAQATVMNSNGAHWLVTCSLPDHQTNTLAFRGVVSRVRGTLPTSGVPSRISGSVSLLTSPSDLDLLCPANKVWETAKTPAQLQLSLELAAASVLRGMGGYSGPASLLPFEIGTDFYASLERNQAAGQQTFASAVLNKCARILAGDTSIRFGVMGKPNQIVREADGALAFRVHVTKGSIGLRLMLWKTPTGIEFANVGPKNELVIS